MPTPFSRTVRSLKNDNHKRSMWGLFFGLVMLSGWGAWMFLSQVKVYSSTSEARLEVEGGVYSLEALGSGRVIVSNLSLGKQVKKGELLIELDSESQRLQLAETEKLLPPLPRLIASKEAQILAIEQGGDSGGADKAAAKAEAEARYEEANIAAEALEVEMKRIKGLYEKGIQTEAEYLTAKAKYDQAKANANTLKKAIKTAGSGAGVEKSERAARIASLQGEIETIKGDIASKESAIERLKDDILKRKIVAPADGEIAEVSEFKVGAVVQTGDKLAVILPPGQLKTIAEFIPENAVGRLQPGQKAQLELDGFPWTEYGRVPAIVERVASETRNGLVKVEFSIHPTSDSKIPLQHGMPGKIEVEVDVMTPAALILRSAGQMVSSGLSGGSQGAAAPAK